jgi:RHS repeat-associated protein
MFTAGVAESFRTLGMNGFPRRPRSRRGSAFIGSLVLTAALLVTMDLPSVMRTAAAAVEPPPGGIVSSPADVGWTEGQFAVTDDGSATYNVPLWKPSGRGDVAPPLSLSYDSGGGNGLLGVGWSLSGLQSIAPCPRILALDGVTDGVRFDSSDVFCLGGSRLLPVASPAPGQREFRTEQQSFSKIVAFGLADDGVPDSFTVWAKDGSISTFGGTNDSRLQAFRLTGGTSPGTVVRASTTKVTLAWNVNKIEDRNGNAATIGYERFDGSADQLWRVESRPQVIRYAPNREVRFIYNPSTEPRPDPIESFGRGVHVMEQKRLIRIEMWGGPQGQPADMLRQYLMSYSNDSITRRSRIVSITEADKDLKEKQPITFEWTKGGYNVRAINTGVLDAGQYHYSDVNTAVADNRILVMDVNADGMQEIVYPSTLTALRVNTAQNWRVRKSDGERFLGDVTTGFQPPRFRCTNPDDRSTCSDPYGKVMSADMDLDGRPDVLVWMSNGEQRWWRLMQSNGSSFVPYPQDIGTVENGEDADPAYLADLDGNGTTDFVTATHDQPSSDPDSTIDGPWRFRLNTGEAGDQRFADATSAGKRTPERPSGNKVVDVDNDGRMDLVAVGQTGWGLDHTGDVRTRQFPIQRPGSVTVDVNGDGLPDAVSALSTAPLPNPPPPGQLRASLNIGNSGLTSPSESPPNYAEPRGFEPITDPEEPPNPEPGGPPAPKDYDRGVRYADFNGDGVDDVIVFHGGQPTSGSDFDDGVQLYIWRAGSFERVTLHPNGLAAGDWGPKGFNTQLIDIDGNGMLDILHVQGNQLVVLKRTDPVPDRLIRIGDTRIRGQVDIDYSTLANPNVHKACESDYPVQCLRTGGLVVQRHTVTTDLDGTPGNNVVHSDVFTHRYKAARMDLRGRGWLGFAEHTVIQGSTGASTVTTFDNSTFDPAVKAYTHAHVPATVTTLRTDRFGPLGRERQTTVVNEPFTHRYPGGGYRVEHTRVTSTESERAVDASAWTVLRRNVTTTTFDDYGNADLTVSATTNGRTTTENPTFENRLGTWLLGLPVRTLIRSCSAGVDCTTRETTADFDAAGNPTVTVTEPNNPTLKLTVTTEYGNFGTIESIERKGTVGQPRTQTFRYDADWLAPTATTNAAGHTTVIKTHSGLGVPLATTDPNGVKVTQKYDRFGRLVETNRSDGSFERIDRAYFGWHIAQTTVSGGGMTTVYTDQMGRERQRQVKRFDGSLANVYTTYDSLGRGVHQVSRPVLSGGTPQYTTTDYDLFGRVVAVTEPDGARVRTEYLNREVHTYDARGTHRYTASNVDGEIAASFEDDPDSSRWLETSFEYGPFGQTERTTAADDTVQVMEYDVLGHRTKLTDPNSGETTTTYTAFGEVDTETDAENQLTRFSYDTLGRVTAVTSVDGTETNVWDTASMDGGRKAKGLLAKATSTDGVVTTHTYTDVAKTKTSTWTVAGVSYQFDYGYGSFGRQTSLTYPAVAIPGGSRRLRVDYSFNPAGYLQDVKDAATGTAYWTALETDPDGQLTLERYGNQTLNRRFYDNRTGQLTTVLTDGPAGVGQLSHLSYGYDLNGNVAERFDVTNGRRIRYDYDTINRLTRWYTTGSTTPAAGATFTYDEVGNHRSETFNRTGQPPQTTTYAYQPDGPHPHALTSLNGQTYTYDALGRQKTGDGRSIVYNIDDLPKSMTWGQIERTSLRYDAAGKRVTKQDRGKTITTIDDLFEVRNPAGTGSAQVHSVNNIVVEGRVVAQAVVVQDRVGGPIVGAKTYYLHQDLLGSTSLVTNVGGREVGDDDEGWLRDVAYDPYGRRVDGNFEPLGPQHRGGPRQGFTGHEHDDELGLINMRGRVYDPKQRRFLTVDPFVAEPLASQSYNPYSYVQNNPATGTDPTGLWYRNSWEGAGNCNGPCFAGDRNWEATSAADLQRMMEESPWLNLLGADVALHLGGGPGVPTDSADDQAPSVAGAAQKAADMAGRGLVGSIAGDIWEAFKESAGDSAEDWADLHVKADKNGDTAMKVLTFVMGAMASLADEENGDDTAITLATAGLGGLASAGRLGFASKPINSLMGVLGAAQTGLAAGQAITGTSLTGEDLSLTERAIYGALAVAGLVTLSGKGKGVDYPKARTGPGTAPPSQRDPTRRFSRKQTADNLKNKQAGKCARCGTKLDPKDAQGHHTKRWADGGRTRPANLDALCKPCHRWTHSGE